MLKYYVKKYLSPVGPITKLMQNMQSMNANFLAKLSGMGLGDMAGGILSAIGSAVGAAGEVVTDATNKMLDWQKDGIDDVANKASKVAAKFGPWGWAAAGIIQGANFLSKAGGEKVEGFDGNTGSSGFADYSMDSKQFRSNPLDITSFFTKSAASLVYENKVKKLKEKFAEAKSILEELKDQSEASAQLAQAESMKAQLQLAGGADYSTILAKHGAKLNLLKNTKYTKKEYKPITSYLKDGGELENLPSILSYLQKEEELQILRFKDGGKTEKKDRDIDELIEYAKLQNPRFIQRMSEPVKSIDWEETDSDGNTHGYSGTHLMAYRGSDVYPMIQEMPNGELKKFDNPDEAYEFAKSNKNIISFNSENEAKLFSEDNYKKGWKDFFKEFELSLIDKFKDGGSVIPSGALHKNKHHIEEVREDLDGEITKKGIPVITENEDGTITLHAEIEQSEIILEISITKKLEELWRQNTEESAISAGKLLAEEIMTNTEDNTNLIKSIKA